MSPRPLTGAAPIGPTLPAPMPATALERRSVSTGAPASREGRRGERVPAGAPLRSVRYRMPDLPPCSPSRGPDEAGTLTRHHSVGMQTLPEGRSGAEKSRAWPSGGCHNGRVARGGGQGRKWSGRHSHPCRREARASFSQRTCMPCAAVSPPPDGAEGGEAGRSDNRERRKRVTYEGLLRHLKIAVRRLLLSP